MFTSEILHVISYYFSYVCYLMPVVVIYSTEMHRSGVI